MCYILEFISNCLSSDTFWNGITAIATCIIGLFAYKISREQLRIEKYKKDDFLYEKRLALFQSYTSFLVEVINELMRLHNTEISVIDKEFVRPKFLEINRIRDVSHFIFNDIEIEKMIFQTREEFCHIFGVNNNTLFSPEETGAVVIEWDRRLSDGRIRKIFAPYLNLEN